MNTLLHKRPFRVSLTAGVTVAALALARLAGAQVVGPSPQEPVQLTKPALEVTKTADRTSAKPGDVVTYTVTIKNTGTAAATGLKVSDILPIGFTVTTNNANTYDFTFLGQLDPGQTTSTSYSAKVVNVTANGEYVNVATVAASNHDPVTVRSTVNVNIPVVQGVTTEERGQESSGTVLGAEDELAATGPGALDLLIALAGLGLAGAGLVGLRRRAS